MVCDRKPLDRGDGTFYIPLTRGAMAIVDAEDVALASKNSWCVDIRKNTSYAKARVGKRTIYLHRVLMGDVVCVDHINGDGLDNRRCNLRPADYRQNGANTRSVYGESKHKGVSRSPSKLNPWRAEIKYANCQRSLGVFADEISAARAYNLAAVKLDGEFFALNDVPDGPIVVRNRFTDGYGARKVKRSGYKGVIQNKYGTYDVRIWVSSEKRSRSVGVYASAIDAALAYDKAAINLYGDLAVTNASLGLLTGAAS